MMEKTTNDLKSRLRAILSRHEGKGQAITSRELAALTGHPDRAIRLAIRELIAENLAVASSTEPPAGYFLPLTRAEAEQYAESIKGRLIEDALRRRDFRRAAAMRLKPAEQGKLL
jgi:DNA-binding GntR family transcriptional regulator